MNMEQSFESMSAAWPWIVMGILLAIFFALFHEIDARRKKKGKKEKEQDINGLSK